MVEALGAGGVVHLPRLQQLTLIHLVPAALAHAAEHTVVLGTLWVGGTRGRAATRVTQGLKGHGQAMGVGALGRAEQELEKNGEKGSCGCHVQMEKEKQEQGGL